MPYLKVEKFKKMYGKKVIFEDISFSAHKGEFVTLLGPSGCGKSTLLQCIAGLANIDKGRLFLNHKDLTKLSAQKRKIGMVFQHYALFPNLNVYENIAFGLKIQKLKKKQIQKKVWQMLELVELSEFGHVYPNMLSGGQKQRVALARSLIMQPDLLLLDEPFSALDARIRKHLRQQVKMIQRQFSLTTLLVTHDQEEALELSDRVILLHQGKIMQNSKASDLYLMPKNQFVASFVGDYNLLDLTDLDELGILHSFSHPIALRPEAIEFGNEGISGVIKQKIFLGNVISYEVLVGGLVLRVDVLNFSPSSALCEGDEVKLKLNLQWAKEMEC